MGASTAAFFSWLTSGTAATAAVPAVAATATTVAIPAVAATAATQAGILTIAETAAAASAVYSLANQPKIGMPPSPLLNPLTQDISVHQAEQEERSRQQSRAGIVSTLGTPGGEQGSALNPTTLSQKSLLGA